MAPLASAHLADLFYRVQERPPFVAYRPRQMAVDVEDAQTLDRELAVDRAVAQPRRDRLAEPFEEGLEPLCRLGARPQPVGNQCHGLAALADRLELVELGQKTFRAALVENGGEHGDDDKIGLADEIVDVAHPQVGRCVDHQPPQVRRRVANLLAPVQPLDSPAVAVAQLEPGQARALSVHLGQTGDEAPGGKCRGEVGGDRRLAATAFDVGYQNPQHLADASPAWASHRGAGQNRSVARNVSQVSTNWGSNTRDW